ncbi:uncharacterized protein LOC133159687 isoform X3 [Syngnathus typhle]|uniref:uncharacterized protein LOC133159687 isoform X3 n=1 Tax=Syngnathus typhle TaxID=161592 RepID=UPI002A6A0AA6|nr:uncharacterized protein LOC133159687 isoform X3 [Syngnathus typhle]
MVKQYSLVSLLYHLLALVASSPDSARHLEYVLKGQEINFLPSIPGKPDLVGWIHDGIDVVWFDLQMGKDVFPPYEDRITLNQESARLIIKDATYEDSGNYDLKLMINGQHHRLKYRIEVIDKVDQPHISCVLTSPNRVLLICSTDSKHPDLLEFKWSSDGKEHPGPNWQINVRGKHDDRLYRCEVSNPLTKETANFTAGDCFLEPFEKTKKRIRRSPCNTPDVSQDLKYVLKGQEINLKPPIPEKPDLIIWFYHDGRGVVLFDDKGELHFPSYEDRIILNHSTAELTINNATYEDSGNYTLSWNINNEECRLKYPVEVIDKVDQPHISCVLTSPNRVLLVCSTESKHPDLLEFKWSSDGKEHAGPNLQINVRGKHDDRVYRCDVSNPLTKETANFTAGDCFLVSQDLKYVLKGQEINLKPPIPEKPDLIIWFYHDGRGVVLFDDKGELNFPSYEDRIILNHSTAELTINNATYEDSGNYTLSWKINNEECRLKYPVEVIDKVTKPNISCEMVNLKQAFLECLTEGKSDPLLKFNWRSQGTEQTGPILKINLSDEQHVYHCDVSNPLTNETASFLAKDCFLNAPSPDSARHLEYVLKGKEINFPPSIPGKPDLVRWMHDGRDVVTFDPQTGKEDVSPSYKDRITLEKESARLIIKNATYEDSGNYDLKFRINDKHDPLKYRIEVIDNVTKPNISCEMVNLKQAFLECLTEGKSDPLLKFKWRSQGTEQTCPILKINLSNEQYVYHCDVSNPLTNETASFLAKDCFLNNKLNSTDWIYYVIVVCLVIGFIAGYLFRTKWQCSEPFEIIRAKCFETTEVASPSAAMEMKPLVTLSTNQTRKRNLGSERLKNIPAKDFEKRETTEVASPSAPKEMIPPVRRHTM